MSLLSWISSAPKAVDNILDSDKGLLKQFGGYINDLNLSDAEVLAQNAKTVSNAQDFVKATLGESTERSKTRRKIAWMWIKAQLSLVMLCAIAAPWNMDLAEFYFKLASCAMMAGGTMAIIIFHFGSYGLARHNESKNAK